MNHIFLAACACVWAITQPLIAYPQSLPTANGGYELTLPDALVIAQQRSTLLTAQDAAMHASLEMGLAAAQRPEPILRFGVNNWPITGPDRYSLTRDFMTMRSIGIAQEFTGNEKREAKIARYQREAEVAQASREMALVALQRDVATAWLSRHFQERLQTTLIAQRSEAKLQIEAADLAYRIAKGSQADVFAARLAAGQVEDLVALGERSLASASARMARWLGGDATRPLGAAPLLDFAPIVPELAETHIKSHPQLKVLERQEQVVLADAVIAGASKTPDWTAELMFSQRGSGFSNMVSINFSRPLPWNQALRQDREVNAKLALAEQLSLQREDLRREHLAELNGTLLEWQSNRDRLIRFEKQLIPLGHERITASLVAYRSGSGNLTSVLEARRMVLDLEVAAIRLAMETAALWAQLNYLIPAHQNLRSAVQEKQP